MFLEEKQKDILIIDARQEDLFFLLHVKNQFIWKKKLVNEIAIGLNTGSYNKYDKSIEFLY